MQLKVLEAGDRSSQVGHDGFQLLAWILQRGCFQEWRIQREIPSHWFKGDSMKRRWTEEQIVCAISVCLIVLELVRDHHKHCLFPRVWKRDARESSGERLREMDVWGEERRIQKDSSKMGNNRGNRRAGLKEEQGKRRGKRRRGAEWLGLACRVFALSALRIRLTPLLPCLEHAPQFALPLLLGFPSHPLPTPLL